MVADCTVEEIPFALLCGMGSTDCLVSAGTQTITFVKVVCREGNEET